MKIHKVIAAAILFIVSWQPLQGRVTITLSYFDQLFDNDIGFDDPIVGEARRQALQEVADYVGSILDHEAIVNITVQPSLTQANNATIASASSTLKNSATKIRNFTAAETIQSNSMDGNTVGILTVNFGKDFYLGDGVPGPGQLDFRSVMIHELAHVLGLISAIRNGDTGAGSGTRGMYSIYDTHLIGAGGEPLLINTDTLATFNSAVFSDGPDADTTIDAFTDRDGLNGDVASGVFFNGPNAVAVLGRPVAMWTPFEYSTGSSLSHVNRVADPALADDPLLPGITPAVVRREYTPLNLAMLKDIGYSIIEKTSFAEFAAVNYPEGIRGKQDDATGNGITNFQEYIHVISDSDYRNLPLGKLQSASDLGLSSGDPEDLYLTLEVRIRETALDAIIVPRAATNLANLASGAADALQVGPPIDLGEVLVFTYRTAFKVSEESRGFMVADITEPE